MRRKESAMSVDFEKQMIRDLGEIIGTVRQIDRKLDSLSARVAALESRRGGWWDWFLKTGIGTIIGGAIMSLLAHLGKQP
jgi:hypothetical protein